MRDRLSDAQVRYIAPLVLAAMTAKKLNAAEVGKKAGYDEKLVRALANYGTGLPRERGSEICTALEVDMDRTLRNAGLENGASNEIVNQQDIPTEFGRYTLESHGHLIEDYTTIRPTYVNSLMLKCYRTEISWNKSLSRLCFAELNRADDYGQSGQVYISPGSAYVCLLSINKGWVRTVLVSQPVDKAKVMCGLILSQFRVDEVHRSPICSPIAYLKQSKEAAEPHYGEITEENQHYVKYMTLVQDTIRQSFARVVLPPGAEHHQ
jgi:hypothetical protein